MKKKVIHMICSDGPGGGPRSVRTMIEDQATVYDVSVVCGGAGVLSATAQNLDLEVKRFWLEKIWMLPIGMIQLFFYLRSTMCDVLILHGQWAAPIGTVVGKCAGVRGMIYICRWPAFFTDWDLYRVIRNYLLEKIPCQLSDLVITISESNRRRYVTLRLAEPEKIITIANPVSLEQIPDDETVLRIRHQLDWKDSYFHVVSVGRLSDQKRVDWLIHAWSEVAKQLPLARLWIAGDGPEEETLRKLAESLGINDSCVFLGAQSSGWELIAASDLVVMTSMYEARGNVVTEAMACSKPVVANKVDGICDSMTDGVEGYLVPPADPHALAERIVELAGDPQRCRMMGEQGRRTVQKFDRKVILPLYRKVIQEL